MSLQKCLCPECICVHFSKILYSCIHIAILVAFCELDKELKNVFHGGPLVGLTVPALLHELLEVVRTVRRDLRPAAFQHVQSHSHEVTPRERLLPGQHLQQRVFVQKTKEGGYIIGYGTSHMMMPKLYMSADSEYFSPLITSGAEQSKRIHAL